MIATEILPRWRATRKLARAKITNKSYARSISHFIENRPANYFNLLYARVLISLLRPVNLHVAFMHRLGDIPKWYSACCAIYLRHCILGSFYRPDTMVPSYMHSPTPTGQGVKPHATQTTGFFVLFYGSPISWKNVCQSIVALSSAEEEYLKMSTAAKEL